MEVKKSKIKNQNYNLKFKSNFLLFTLIFAFCLLPFAFRETLAQTRVVSPRYEIQLPDRGFGVGIPESADDTPGDIVKKSYGDFGLEGYITKIGFQYVQKITPFSFSVSTNAISFGTLRRNTPKTVAVALSVNAGGAEGYSLKAFENHPLQDENGNFVIDTLCDTACNENQAESWTSDTKYGFGFDIRGDGKYRQFADSSAGEAGPAVISNQKTPPGQKMTITFKINVGPLQEAGTYQNTVTFVAIPTF